MKKELINYFDEMPSIRIINIHANEIYFHMLNKTKLVIKNKDDYFDKHFSDIVPPNLDLLFLSENKLLELKFIQDEYYSYDFINVSFSNPLYINDKGEQVYKKKDSVKEYKADIFREEIYKHGFTLNSKKYVRYKRSSGAAKNGSCLFVRKELYDVLNEWTKTGLDEDKDLCFKSLTSYEAYKALSLSSLIKKFKLNPYNILFVKDFKTYVKDEKVIKVTCNEEKNLEASTCVTDVENNIFDGEGLLDTSVFKNAKFKKKGMMLLRNRFFKCCAFQTKLQDWFKANNITSTDQLHGITFAKDVKDIVLVASESCLKYLKMVEGGFNKENIKRWCDAISYEDNSSWFGVVKTDKKTRFFKGQMVETTYQFLNTLQMKYKDINVLMSPYMDYIDKIRNIKETPEFVRFFLEGELDDSSEKDLVDDSEGDFMDEVEEFSTYTYKTKMCLDLIKIDQRFKHTELFKHHVYQDIINAFALKLYNGRVLVRGTYATLFGNPYEFLKYIIIKDGKQLFSEENKTSILGKDEICCSFFPDNYEIAGSRAPHTTMGNVLYAKNKALDEINKWFVLSKNIVVVDAINNNIQHRLSGCDYDSDSVLLTCDKTIVSLAKKNYHKFLVPVAGYDKHDKPLDKKKTLMENIIEMDKIIAKNSVGQIINLSQLLNSHLWNRFGERSFDYKELYSKIAILSVLSGAEIDSSKRTFDFNTKNQYNRINRYAIEKGYRKNKPVFFVNLSRKGGNKLRIGEIEDAVKDKLTFKTTMDYLWDYVGDTAINNTYINTISLFELIGKGFTTDGISASIYNQIKKAAINLILLRRIVMAQSREKRYNKNFDLKKNDFNYQIKKCYEEIKININSPKKVKLLVKFIEKKDYIESLLEEIEKTNASTNNEAKDEKKKKEKVSSISLLYFLIYIIIISKKDLGFTIKDLFPKGTKGMPTLREAKNNEKPDYKLFNTFRYKIVE